VPVISEPQQFNEDELFVDLRSATGRPLFLKCEGFNFAGSIKLKAAIAMIEAAEAQGRLRPGTTLVESSSGNLGVALAVVAASRGYEFLCVTDARCNETTRNLMSALGTRVHTMHEPDPVTGFLGARLGFISRLCASDDRYLWLNQYASPDNWRAHYRTTAPAIDRCFPQLDVLFVGAGTTGTLMGCARYFREFRPRTHVVAVDAVGSVSFGHAPAPRFIPGLGMSVPPPQLDADLVDEVLHVAEPDAIRTCHELAARGFLLGGSTGTVVSGAGAWLDRHGVTDASDLTAVAISPDLGERYLDTIYRSDWVTEHYGPAAAVPGALVTGGVR
jgi:N-(2-amino-2-carboxyethyl)-L-glutamate synthase